MLNPQEIKVYDKFNAKTLCDFSALAYDPKPVAPAGWVIKAVVAHKTRDILALIIESDADIVAVFRGTVEDLKNYALDADCRRIKWTKLGNGVAVHRGFYTGYTDMRDDILAQLYPACLTKSLWLTGHSLGGAFAVTAAADGMAGGMFGLPSIYTYGQPRVGNLAFTDWIDARLVGRFFRIVHSADIVPRVPHFLWATPESSNRIKLMGDLNYPREVLWHGGVDIFFDADGVQWVNPPYYKKIPSDLKDVARKALKLEFAGFDDHHVAQYQSACDTALFHFQ